MSSDPRRFGTADLVVMIGLWSIMAVVLGGVISEVLRDGETPIARAQSEVLAHQLLDAGFSDESAMEAVTTAPSTQSSRSPAAIASEPIVRVKKMGKDPWGHAYHYVSLPHLQAVVVWSAGRDGRNNSVQAVERLILAQSHEDFRFEGDDVGVLQKGPSRGKSRTVDEVN